MKNTVYDIIGIGIGPFNLGMAAMLEELPELSALFLESRPEFNWHPGLLLPGARMQVPFYADLITIVNPRSPYTFINYLQQNKKFFRYANHDNHFPLRIEYNSYCQWVVKLLKNLRFDEPCELITYDSVEKIYSVLTNAGLYKCRHVLLGTGTAPVVPATLKNKLTNNILHSSEYLLRKEDILQHKKISIIGSGQSAAEIFQDLLPHAEKCTELAWFTRANRFHPMDYTRFTTEMTSLDYIDHFYKLPPKIKDRVLRNQQYLFKGINAQLIAAINDELYVRGVNGLKNNSTIYTNTELLSAVEGEKEGIVLGFEHKETGEAFLFETGIVIAATGYQYQVPDCILPLLQVIDFDERYRYNIKRNYSIDCNNTLFVQNADLHTHGFNSADLGMGPYRNATILNAILGREYFTMEKGTAFQTFGIPS